MKWVHRNKVERRNEGNVCPLAGVPISNEASKENQVPCEHSEDNCKCIHKVRVTEGWVARHKATATKDDCSDCHDDKRYNKRTDVDGQRKGWTEEGVDRKEQVLCYSKEHNTHTFGCPYRTTKVMDGYRGDDGEDEEGSDLELFKRCIIERICDHCANGNEHLENKEDGKSNYQISKHVVWCCTTL